MSFEKNVQWFLVIVVISLFLYVLHQDLLLKIFLNIAGGILLVRLIVLYFYYRNDEWTIYRSSTLLKPEFLQTIFLLEELVTKVVLITLFIGVSTVAHAYVGVIGGLLSIGVLFLIKPEAERVYNTLKKG